MIKGSKAVKINFFLPKFNSNTIDSSKVITGLNGKRIFKEQADSAMSSVCWIFRGHKSLIIALAMVLTFQDNVKKLL